MTARSSACRGQGERTECHRRACCEVFGPRCCDDRWRSRDHDCGPATVSHIIRSATVTGATTAMIAGAATTTAIIGATMYTGAAKVLFIFFP